MSGYFESVRWNACVHRLDLGLYSHPKELWGNGARTHVNSKGNTPLPEKFSSEEDQTHDAASSKTGSPTHYQRHFRLPYLSYFVFVFIFVLSRSVNLCRTLPNIMHPMRCGSLGTE